MIQFVHCRNKKNAGDMWSNPLNYLHVDAPTVSLGLDDPIDTSGSVIFGGGGILKYAPQIPPCDGPRIIWGAGVNRPHLRDQDTIRGVSGWDLVGIRDWDRGYPWVPCASCLHEAFHRKYDILYEFVVMEGSRLGIRGLPAMRCNVGKRIDEFVKHLGSGETIITSSYHGWYWGTLLGRRVVVIPNEQASKFYHLRWPTPLATVQDWRAAARRSQAYPEALQQARAANVQHMLRAAGVLGTPLRLRTRRELRVRSYSPDELRIGHQLLREQFPGQTLCQTIREIRRHVSDPAAVDLCAEAMCRAKRIRMPE